MKLFYLSLVSFLLIASSSLAIAVMAHPQKVIIVSNKKVNNFKEDLPLLPVLTGKSSFPILSAQAVMAIDMASGVTLYEKNPDGQLLPASTTKIVTALVALDYYPLNQVLKVDGIKIDGQKMHLVKGEKITVENLLYGLLVYSANDAAEVLAANFPGGKDEFVYTMNKKAQELHLSKSYFTNPSGLDGDGIGTTARDLAIISQSAMKNPFFRKIVSTKETVVTSTDGKIVHKLKNVNELLGKVDGVLGVKTGWTEAARENLVSYIERDGKYVMVVVLGSQDRFGETEELIEWIFGNYEWRKIEVPQK